MFDKFGRERFVDKETWRISWLRDTATEHIAKMREAAEILTRHGHSVEMLKEPRPGYVVYEDEWQVVAEPFADSAT